MSHIPYGYVIQDGQAVIDEETGGRVRELFQAYLSGLSLTDAANKAGIQKVHPSIALMLKNERYLGDGFYPPLIDTETFRLAEAERFRRAQALGRLREPEEKKERLVKMRFTAHPTETLYADPFAQEEYAFSLIESDVIANGE